MFYNAKEADVQLKDGKMHYISFGRGDKTLVMIPGLRLSEIDGSSKIVSMYYRIFAKEYTVYMFDKKDIREGRKSNEEEETPVILGRCAQPPQYRPYECYAERVLRRDRKELKEAYDSLHESNLEEYNKIYFSLLDKKRKYFGVKEE